MVIGGFMRPSMGPQQLSRGTQDLPGQFYVYRVIGCHVIRDTKFTPICKSD